LISATIRQIKGAELVAKIIKGQNPTTTVVLGGPGPSALATQHRDLSKDTRIDITVKGEAEDLLPLVLQRLGSGEPIDDVPNLIINKEGNIINTRVDPALPDVRTIPWPDRSIFDEEAYLSRWRDSAKMTSVHIMGSRGCPFTCSFCDRTVTGRRVRYRDVEDVASEMLFLEKRYSPDDIFYFDDLFTVNKKRVIAL
jgi:anaerobic magnesium-protoporphyrin IX monomethyl ester cyclase